MAETNAGEAGAEDEAASDEATPTRLGLWMWLMILGSTALTIAGLIYYYGYVMVTQTVVVKGRPLRRWGRARVAAAELEPSARTAWEAWHRDALSEHAAAAAFQRLALELLALGAPAELVTRSQRAALEEMRHAELCRREAERLRGAPVAAPGALPSAMPSGLAWRPRAARLTGLALDSLFDGALTEGTAAALAAAAAEGCEDAQRRASLAEIAADELEHAELAWDILVWAQRAGGHMADAALRRAAARLGALSVEPAETSLSSEALRASGLWSAEAELAAFERQRDGLNARLAAHLQAA